MSPALMNTVMSLDWFSMLNFGHRFWAVGSSDSHHVRTSPIGYPRTCIHFGHDDITQLTPESVRDGVLSGATLTDGDQWRVQARAYDVVGNTSTYTGSRSIIYDGMLLTTEIIPRPHPDLLRAQKDTSAGTIKFVWDEQNYLLEADGSNVVTTRRTAATTSSVVGQAPCSRLLAKGTGACRPVTRTIGASR